MCGLAFSVGVHAQVLKPFPDHWGEPPALQTRDLRPLPGGYGRGSSTLARWIQEHLDQDASNDSAQGEGNFERSLRRFPVKVMAIMSLVQNTPSTLT